jgi:gamma-glutamyltranspeptidase/glutathione hydrolase
VAATFKYGAVVGQPESDSAAVSVLKKGGNAVDAAVTAAFLACVLAPKSCGIGGYGGMMTAYINGEVVSIDFNTVAPQAANSKMFQVTRSDGRFGSVVRDFANEVGYGAVSVPGVLAGLALALEKFGKMPLADVLAPAIRACERGFRISANYAAGVAEHEARIREFSETARLLLIDGEVPKSGDRGKNTHLAKMLSQVADKGVREFYEGRIADRISKHMEENGGILSRDDLANYEARVVEPVHTICMEYDVYSSPLTSAGMSLAQMCGLADEVELDLYARDAAKLAHGMVEIIRAAWMDRYRHFGDPRQMDVPTDMLLSDINMGATSKEIAAHIAAGTHGQSLLRPLYTGGTTHICTADAQINMVSLTLTHGPSFGSFVTIPRMGLLMNAGMSRFDPGSGLKNSTGPGKAPIMNMCPAIVLREGAPFMTIGASGGTRIPSSVFQVLARRLVLEEDAEWSVAAPRVHSEGNEWVRLEDEFGEAAPDYLKSIGYTINKKGSAAANVRMIEVTEDGFLAAYDPRMKAREKGY